MKESLNEAPGELGIFKTSEESLTESDYITEARGYGKVKDLDRTKSLWELRTLYGMSYLVVSYSPQVDETAVFKADKNGKILSFIEVFSTRGRLDPEPIIRGIASGKIKPMDEGVMEENIVEAWTADSVSRNADIGSDKGYGINIRKGGGITKAPYKHMLIMRTSGKKIKVRFDFGKDEFVGTPQEVADHINEILGIK